MGKAYEDCMVRTFQAPSPCFIKNKSKHGHKAHGQKVHTLDTLRRRSGLRCSFSNDAVKGTNEDWLFCLLAVRFCKFLCAVVFHTSYQYWFYLRSEFSSVYPHIHEFSIFDSVDLLTRLLVAGKSLYSVIHCRAKQV